MGTTKPYTRLFLRNTDGLGRALMPNQVGRGAIDIESEAACPNYSWSLQLLGGDQHDLFARRVRGQLAGSERALGSASKHSVGGCLAICGPATVSWRVTSH